MTFETQQPLKGLELTVLIAMSKLKYQQPKKHEDREHYDKDFARKMVRQLENSGWEFRHIEKNLWTGKPLDHT
jgi:hypothetical protein